MPAPVEAPRKIRAPRAETPAAAIPVVPTAPKPAVSVEVAHPAAETIMAKAAKAPTPPDVPTVSAPQTHDHAGNPAPEHGPTTVSSPTPDTTTTQSADTGGPSFEKLFSQRTEHGGAACGSCPLSEACSGKVERVSLKDPDPQYASLAAAVDKEIEERTANGERVLGKPITVEVDGEKVTVTAMRVPREGIQIVIPNQATAEDQVAPAVVESAALPVTVTPVEPVPTEPISAPPAEQVAPLTVVAASTVAAEIPTSHPAPERAAQPPAEPTLVRTTISAEPTIVSPLAVHPAGLPTQPAVTTELAHDVAAPAGVTVAEKRIDGAQPSRDAADQNLTLPPNPRSGETITDKHPKPALPKNKLGFTIPGIPAFMPGRNSDRQSETNDNRSPIQTIRTRLTESFANFLPNFAPLLEQKRHATGATRVREAVPATRARLMDLVQQATTVATRILGDRVPSIIIPDLTSPLTEGQQKKKRRVRMKAGKQTGETISLHKTLTTDREKPGRKLRSKRRLLTERTVPTPRQEKQKRPTFAIFTQERRVQLHASLRGETMKPPSEIHLPHEQTRPLLLMIPKETPVEQIVGAIVRIAQEKRTKEKSPLVQINVSQETFVALKKVFIQAITKDSMQKPNGIQIMSGDAILTLDVKQLQLLEHLFADFETQLLLLQLRQCLIQSEIKEATVLCGCQQQNTTNVFEKISFCQGCHQGYIQQSFFWLITILWYTIYELALDQDHNQMYTQSYSYEQAIFTS